jgi:hypothetical protein
MFGGEEPLTYLQGDIAISDLGVIAAFCHEFNIIGKNYNRAQATMNWELGWMESWGHGKKKLSLSECWKKSR